MKSAQIIGWALGGLEREISETRARLSQLTSQAGDLRSRLARSGRSAVGRAAAAAAAASSAPPRKRGRRRFTAAQRREISERMKRRWAERKAKAGK
jgi:hypothetical protein